LRTPVTAQAKVAVVAGEAVVAVEVAAAAYVESAAAVVVVPRQRLQPQAKQGPLLGWQSAGVAGLGLVEEVEVGQACAVPAAPGWEECLMRSRSGG